MAIRILLMDDGRLIHALMKRALPGAAATSKLLDSLTAKSGGNGEGTPEYRLDSAYTAEEGL